ncbi:MAG: LytR/AlgR family response regulator transcription factor [Longicatena caecimuris]|uniref:LytR/AlgR family response regulator transcription factor n=1 Tax=Longicatena caecimuris TaxID=1796635 RepID=UPI00399A7570
MKNYKIVVCDDSKDMRDMIYKKLKSLDNINFDVVLADDRTIDLSQEYDAYLLDIEMPHTDGFALATKIHSLYKNALILFLTSHTELSMVGYEYQVFRFIGKNDLDSVFETYMKDVKEELDRRNRYLIAKDEEGNEMVVYLREIICIYSEGNYLNYVTSKQIYRNREKLKNFKGDVFIQASNGMLVNFCHINKIEKSHVLLSNQNKVKLGRTYKKDFLTKVMQCRIASI